VELAGQSAGLGSDDDHRVFVTLRSLCDVVLVGSGTARAENYGPAKLSQPRQARRRKRGQLPLPPVAVVSADASMDPGGRLFGGDDGTRGDGPRPLVLCSSRATRRRREDLSKVAKVIECGDERVDMKLALGVLADEGLTSVLCEGGPTLAGLLIKARLLDELCLSQAMVLAGPNHELLSAGEPFEDVVRLRLGHLLVGDGVVVGRWEVQK